MEENKNNQIESGLKLNNLILLESNFNRVPNVTFNNDKISKNININVTVQVKDNIIFVTEKLDYTQSFNEIQEVSCTIIMAGIFEKIGETEITDLDQFGRVNGAAIIFPYIREHLSSLSSKAGLGLILLSPVNFTHSS
jgi:preprotein translocase subunit SecB